MKPTILIVNDDLQLCASRKMLLESCGAEVYTACGQSRDVEDKLRLPLDLVLIDSTNVGFARGEQLCNMVKRFDSSLCVAILAEPEMGLPERTSADHVILRSGPRQMLVEMNELLCERLDVNLWELTARDGDQGSLV